MASLPVESDNFEMPRGSRVMHATPRGRAHTDMVMRHFGDDEDDFRVTDVISKSAPVRTRVDAIFSLTWERKASDLQNGCYLLIEGRPCKCHRVTFTRGQVHVRAKDIFTGGLFEASFPSESQVEVPIVKRNRYQCVALDEETGIASLRDEKGVIRRDLQMPVKGNDAGLRRQISSRSQMVGMEQYLQALSRGSTLYVIVQVAVGQEEIVSASYDERKGAGGAFFSIVAKLKNHARRIAGGRAERREVSTDPMVMKAAASVECEAQVQSMCASALLGPAVRHSDTSVDSDAQFQSMCITRDMSTLPSVEEASAVKLEGVKLISNAAA